MKVNKRHRNQLSSNNTFILKLLKEDDFERSCSLLVYYILQNMTLLLFNIITSDSSEYFLLNFTLLGDYHNSFQVKEHFFPFLL